MHLVIHEQQWWHIHYVPPLLLCCANRCRLRLTVVCWVAEMTCLTSVLILCPCLPALLQYAITAVGLVVCRHGQIVSMMNCFGGERHAYAILALALLLQGGLALQHWWYDINCRSVM